MNGAKVLCVSPHPDDTELGMGATLNRFRNKFKTVKLLVLSNRKATRREKHNRRDQKKAAEILGIHDIEFRSFPIRFFGTQQSRDKIRLTITQVVKRFEPDIIFTTGMAETMQDHQAVTEEIVRVIRDKSSVLGYEVSKHNRFFRPIAFVNVSEKDIAMKIAAANAFTEFSNKFYFQPEIIRSLARVRAFQAGYFGYAEAFEVYRVMVV